MSAVVLQSKALAKGKGERRRRTRTVRATEPSPSIDITSPSIPITYGMALSGGGTRALACGSGLMRALRTVGILDNCSHMSGVSGGAWATTIYTFAQGLTQDQILIQERETMTPADLTPAFINTEPPETSMLKTATNLCLLEYLAKNPCISCYNAFHMHCLARAGPSTKLAMDWVSIVYATFLKPVGIPYGKHFAQSDEEVARIVAEHPELTADDFIVPAKYCKHIASMGLAMSGPPDDGGIGTSRQPLSTTVGFYETARDANNELHGPNRLTPLEARAKHHNISLVPYTVTPSAVFTKYEGPEMDLAAVSPYPAWMRWHNTLLIEPTSVAPFEFAVNGTSKIGNCLGQRASPFSIEVATALAGQPILKNATDHPSILNALVVPATGSVNMRPSPSAEPRRLLLADGGILENTGLHALLQQGVTDILLCEPSGVPFAPELVQSNPKDAVSVSVSQWFGVDLGEDFVFDVYGFNQVFPNEVYINQLLPQFLECHNAGRPLIATLNTKTVKNVFYGIPEGMDVTVTLMYLHAPAKFIEQLSEEVQAEPTVQPINGSGTFPYFNTIFMNAPEPICLNALQANMLDALQFWCVMSESGKGGKLYDFIKRQKSRRL